MNYNNSSQHRLYLIWYYVIVSLSSLIFGFLLYQRYDVSFKKGLLPFLAYIMNLDFLIMVFVTKSKQKKLIQLIFGLRVLPTTLIQLYFYQIMGIPFHDHITPSIKYTMVVNQLLLSLICITFYRIMMEGIEGIEIELKTDSIKKILFFLINSFALYGIWYITCQCVYELSYGSQLFMLQIFLTVLDIFSMRYVIRYLNSIKVSYESGHFFKFIFHIVFLRKKIYTAKDAIKMRTINFKVCILRSLMLLDIILFVSSSDNISLLSLSNEESQISDIFIFISKCFFLLNISIIAYQLYKILKITKSIFFLNGKQNMNEYQQLENSLKSISKKQHLYIRNIFGSNVIQQNQVGSVVYIKEDAKKPLKLILSESFRFMQDKQKTIIIDDIIYISQNNKTCIRFIKSQETKFLSQLQYIDKILVKHKYSFDEGMQIIMKRFGKFGLFSKNAISTIDEILNMPSKLEQLNGQLMSIICYEKQISQLLSNHTGQILYDLHAEDY